MFTEIFSDPRCNWIREYYCLPCNDRKSFWSFIGTDSHDGLISHFLLTPFECISPELMSNIYVMFCRLSKDHQKNLLSLCYAAKQHGVGKRIGFC